MLKVVLDTNIFVSSIFWGKGNPHMVVELALGRKIQVFVSIDILKELEKVLLRDFEEPPEMVARQLSLVLDYSVVIMPNVKIDVVKDDPDDNKILECAVACNADYVVTGDKHLLVFSAYEQIKIVSAKEFMDEMAGV